MKHTIRMELLKRANQHIENFVAIVYDRDLEPQYSHVEFDKGCDVDVNGNIHYENEEVIFEYDYENKYYVVRSKKDNIVIPINIVDGYFKGERNE